MAIDVLKLPDPQLERYGNLYRLLCKRQGNDVLMWEGRLVPFAEFIFSQEADMERERYIYRLRQKRGLREGRC